jgi:hypothetical protein
MAEKWSVASRESRCPQCHNQIRIGEEIWKKAAGVTYCQLCGHDAEDNPRITGPREEAVIKWLNNLPSEARDHPLAVNMIGLAQQMDDGDVSPRDATLYTKEIRLNHDRMRELFPEHADDDPTDTARDARERRMRESTGI